MQPDGGYRENSQDPLCYGVLYLASSSLKVVSVPTFSTLKSGGTKAGTPMLRSGCSWFQMAGLHTDCQHYHNHTCTTQP